MYRNGVRSRYNDDRDCLTSSSYETFEHGEVATASRSKAVDWIYDVGELHCLVIKGILRHPRGCECHFDMYGRHSGICSTCECEPCREHSHFRIGIQRLIGNSAEEQREVTFQGAFSLVNYGVGVTSLGSRISLLPESKSVLHFILQSIHTVFNSIFRSID